MSKTIPSRLRRFADILKCTNCDNMRGVDSETCGNDACAVTRSASPFKYRVVINLTRTIVDVNGVAERYTNESTSKHKTRAAAEKRLTYMLEMLPRLYDAGEEGLVINSSEIQDI